jgi:competence ComEA-like helix-hairpin-helix protein
MIMAWKEFVKDYLTFTRRDKLAILFLLVLMTFLFFTPALIRETGSRSVKVDTNWMAAIKKLEQKNVPAENSAVSGNYFAYQYDRTENNYNTSIRGQLFYFDPNTISEQVWKKLGLKEKTINTLQNYLSKGGHFTAPEDLKKIYGLKEEEYNRLFPYIRIENSKRDVITPKDISTSPVNNSSNSRYQTIDVNTSDTTGFISLPGIGSKLAARIVNFRDKLGGFYSIDQVGETYGLPDSTFQKIKKYLKLDTLSIKKINVNTATVEELKAHPYIKWNLANPIVAYRNEHGAFSKPEDLKKIMAVTDEIYNKMAPYITF